MTNRVLHVKIISEPCAGEMVFIPRIKLISSEELPFELHRVQFLVRLAFGMIINKSQGQSLRTVELDLLNLMFGYRQFYVGVSRGTNWRRVKVLLKEGRKTENIVYKDVVETKVDLMSCILICIFVTLWNFGYTLEFF